MGRKPKNGISQIAALETILDFFSANPHIAEGLAGEIEKLQDVFANLKKTKLKYTGSISKKEIAEICRDVMPEEGEITWYSPIQWGGSSELTSLFRSKKGFFVVFGKSKSDERAISTLFDQLPARILIAIIRRMAGRDGGLVGDSGREIERKVTEILKKPK